MVQGIPIEELDQETRKALGIRFNLPDENVAPRLDVLGKVLRALKGLTNNNALWVLDEARVYIVGERVVQVPVVKPPVTMKFVVETVAAVFGLTTDLLEGRRKDQGVVLARQVAMYVLMMRKDKYTLTAIGGALGHRSPATISYGFQSVAEKIKRSTTLRNKVEEVQLQVSEGE